MYPEARNVGSFTYWINHVTSRAVRDGVGKNRDALRTNEPVLHAFLSAHITKP